MAVNPCMDGSVREYDLCPGKKPSPVKSGIVFFFFSDGSYSDV